MVRAFVAGQGVTARVTGGSRSDCRDDRTSAGIFGDSLLQARVAVIHRRCRHAEYRTRGMPLSRRNVGNETQPRDKAATLVPRGKPDNQHA
jgi:hypothetical protein